MSADNPNPPQEKVEPWTPARPAITFYCPTCGASVSVPPDQAGTKRDCRACGQRLEVPRPAPNKTVLGSLEPVPVVTPAGSDYWQRLSVSALVSGIASVIMPFIVPIPFGIVPCILAAMVLNSRRGNQGFAVAGLCLGVLGVLFFGIVVAVHLLASAGRR